MELRLKSLKMNAEPTLPQMLFLILLGINCIHAQEYLLVSAPHSKSNRYDNDVNKEAIEDVERSVFNADSDASQNALRIRRRIPPLPRLGRQVDDLLMAKQRRRRSTTGLHASDDIKQSAAYEQNEMIQRAAPLPRLGLRRLASTVEERSIPLPRIGRFVGAFDAASRLDGDDDASEFGYEYDYGTRSSLLPRIGLRTAVVRAAPLPRIGRRNSDDELGVVPFPRLGK